MDKISQEFDFDSTQPRALLYGPENPIDDVFSEVPMTIVRSISKKKSALMLDVEALKLGQGLKWMKTDPIEFIGFEMRFNPDVNTHMTVMVKLNNWYVQMIWTLWLTTGLDLAHRKEASEWFEALPEFVSAHADIHSTHAKLKIDHVKSVECQCSLSLKQPPYKLLFQNPLGECLLAVNLDTVYEFIVSVSTCTPSKLLIKTNVDVAEVYKKPTLTPPSDDKPKIATDPDSPSDKAKEKKPSKKKSVLGALTDSVTGLTNTLQNTLLGHSSAYQAYNATSKLGKVADKIKAEEKALLKQQGKSASTDKDKRRVGGGFLIKKITRAITSTTGAAVKVVSTVGNEVQHGFKTVDAFEYFVVVKCTSTIHRTKNGKGNNLEWNDEELLIDLPPDKLENSYHVSGTLDGITVFLFDATTFGKEELVGVKFIHYSQMIPDSLAGLSDDLESGNPTLSEEPALLDVFLNDKITLTVTLESAHYLRIPVHAHPGGIFATIEFGAWNGACLGEAKSRSASVSKNRHPVWPNGSSMTLAAEDGLQWAEYIRLCFFDGNQVGNMPVGIAYIPISDFEDPDKIDTTQQYSLFNRMHGNYVADEEFRHGFAKVRLRAHIEQGVGRSKVKLSSMFYRSNEFTATWPAEGMLLGNVSALQESNNAVRGREALLDDSVERFTVLAAYKELVLIDINSSISDSARSDVDSITDRKAHNTTSTKTLIQLPDVPEVMTVTCYENERRAFTHGLNWQRLKKCGFSEKDVSKSQPYAEKEDAQPPEGYVWEGDWELDLTHHKTGEGGWIYAVDFNAMKFNLKAGINFTSPFMQSVRRRRWNRKARALESHLKAKILERSESNAWRSEMLAAKGAQPIIGTCFERKSAAHPIKIPWSQVKGSYAVTPTEICIFLTINRFMESHTDKFCEVDAVIFVSGCCAKELKTLIDERSILASTRQDVCTVMTSGHLSDDNDQDLTAWDDGSGHIEAEVMPFGSRVVTDIDSDAIFVEGHIQDLQATMSQCTTIEERATFQQQIGKFMRRASRLRLYIANMLGANLKGKHDYNVESVTKVMEMDFLKAKRILGEDEVTKVNDRVEFLLDAAELRLREAALCGWEYRGAKLEKCIETLVNGYFTEMVGTMGAFFDSDGMKSVQGFGGKLEIIRTFMKHNDRLATILESACNPYRIAPTLLPQLSYFLDVNTLIGWYAQFLQAAMVDVVNNSLAVWRDKSKGASRLTDMYEFLLPWIPDRENAQSGLFKTMIPEDVIRGLKNYILYARVKKSDVAQSFHKTLDTIDVKVHTAYVIALQHLADQYISAVESCDWTAISSKVNAKDVDAEMRQLTEHFEWMCCTINDSYRVISMCYCQPVPSNEVGGGDWDVPALEASVAGTVPKVYNSFANIVKVGIDWLSCILFAKVFSDPSLAKLLSREAFAAWKATAPDLLSSENEQKNSVFVELAIAVAELIKESADALCHDHLFQLTTICANKVVTVFLFILKVAKDEKAVLDRHGPLVLQIERDFKMVCTVFTDLARKVLEKMDVTILAFRDMELAHALITGEKDSKLFKESIHYCVKRSMTRPTMGGALSAFTRCCIGLRPDYRGSEVSSNFASQAAGTMRRMSAMFSKAPAPAPAPVESSAFVAGTMKRMSTIFNRPSMPNAPEASHEADELRLLCDANADIMQSQFDECDMELRNSILVMDPIEKAFAVDDAYSARSMKSLIISSAKIYSQLLDVSSEEDMPITAKAVGRLTFKTLRTSNLPIVNSTRLPHCYVQFLVKDRVIAESQVIEDEVCPDWSSHAISLDVGGGARFLRVLVMLKNYIWDDVPMGFVDIPLISLDVMKGKEQTFALDCSISPATEAAVEKMIAESGEQAPKLYVSIGVASA